MIQTILFDFDGTLFDTGEGILRSVQYALEGFGIHETDTARLRKFVGPPLFDSFSELYAMTPEQAQATGSGICLSASMSARSIPVFRSCSSSCARTDFASQSLPGSPRRWRARSCSGSIWSGCLTA